MPSTPYIGMMFVGKGNGDDFWFNIDRGRQNQVFSGHIGFRRNCQVDYNAEKDILNIQILNCPQLDGDIRILFQVKNYTFKKNDVSRPKIREVKLISFTEFSNL